MSEPYLISQFDYESAILEGFSVQRRLLELDLANEYQSERKDPVRHRWLFEGACRNAIERTPEIAVKQALLKILSGQPPLQEIVETSLSRPSPKDEH